MGKRELLRKESRERLNQVLGPFATADSAAILADSGNDQPMARDAKTMFSSDLLTQFKKLVAAKLNQFVAFLAVKVVVLRVPVIVLVN